MARSRLSVSGRDVVAGDLRLREVTADDAARLFEWRMEPATRAMFGNASAVSFDTHLGFLARYLAAAGHDRWWVIEDRGTPVGTVSLYNVDLDRRQAEWGRFVIDPVHRGRGLGRAALEALLGYCADAGLSRLGCTVLADNPRAVTLYESLGFVPVDSRTDGDGRRFLTLERAAPLGAEQALGGP